MSSNLAIVMLAVDDHPLICDGLAVLIGREPDMKVVAQDAAETAEAAGAQGKSWEMHDTLFEPQRRLNPSGLVEYAERVGLEMKRFRQELENGTWEGTARDHFRGGVMIGVNGTLTFFINGVRHDGDYSVSAILAAA